MGAADYAVREHDVTMVLPPQRHRAIQKQRPLETMAVPEKHLVALGQVSSVDKLCEYKGILSEAQHKQGLQWRTMVK